MGKKILDSKALYVVLAVLIAISLWFYVVSLDGNEDTQTIGGIPVQFLGLEELEERNLMIVGETPTVSLRLTATMSTLARLNRDTITVTVDVSGITEAADYTMGYTVAYPSGVSAGAVQEVSRSPANVSFTVARYRESEVELRGVFMGSAAEGYLAGDENDFAFSPGTITVSGQAAMVNQVAYARVVISDTELTETVTGEYHYELMSNSGEVLEGLDVECSAETVSVTFPVWATEEVPLVVRFNSGGGATEDNVAYEIQPGSNITVAGSKADVDAISEIVLGTVDLANIRDGDSMTFSIPLADELTNVSGFSEVTVIFHILELETKTVETTNISCINEPDGWRPTLVTQAITVEVRGTAEALEGIIGENIRVVADLADINQAAGQYTMAARVYLDSVGSDAGVVGTDYRLVVSLTR